MAIDRISPSFSPDGTKTENAYAIIVPMKNLWSLFALFLFASQVNATPTPTLQSLTLTLDAATLNKDHNTTLKVTARYDDNSTEDATDKVQWQITPPGAVRISGHILTALKDVNVTLRAKSGSLLSKPVTLSIYWEVNGHRLPPEPDPAVNNATLLGVDSNHNGVRDDVERWIYEKYKEYIPCDYISDRNITMPDGTIMPTVKKVCAKHPIPYHPVVRAVAMQGARAAQIIIQHPEKARETTKIFDNAQDCSWYLFDLSKEKNDSSIGVENILIHEFDNIQYNTTLRAKAYAKYNYYLSGGVYELPTDEQLIKGCDNKIKQMIKDLK